MYFSQLTENFGEIAGAAMLVWLSIPTLILASKPRRLEKRARLKQYCILVNKPDGQLSTVRPQASFSFFSKAFYSEVVPPPLANIVSEYFPIILGFKRIIVGFGTKTQQTFHPKE